MKRSTHYSYGCPSINAEDIARVGEALSTDMISQGGILREFEETFASHSGAEHCLAVANGTCGLHLALLAMGVMPGDRVWTSPLTFAATGNAALMCGASVDFVDIDPRTWNMDADALADKLHGAEREGLLPKVVVPVHFAGMPCDMSSLAQLAERFQFDILEDACHALGARCHDERVGGCKRSRATVFSLHPVKNITSAEGGLVTTNDPQVHERMKLLRNHGMVRESLMDDADVGPWHTECRILGYNYRISEPQCALGLSQLGRLDVFLERRRTLVGRYLEHLPDGVQTQGRPNDENAAWHILVLRTDFRSLGLDKRRFHARMAERGIHLAVHYYPLHLHPLYMERGFCQGMFPNAEAYYREAFTFPLHTKLDVEDVDHICHQLKAELPLSQP